MKVKPWLSIFFPPAVLALALLLPQPVRYVSPYPFIQNLDQFLPPVLIGFASGLIIPLCFLASGASAKSLRINGSRLLAGIMILTGSFIASAVGGYAKANRVFLPYAIFPLSIAIFAGMYIIGSINIGNHDLGGRKHRKDALLALIVPVGIYVFNAVIMLLLTSSTPQDAAADPRPITRVLKVAYFSIAMLSIVLAPLAVPVSVPNKTVTALMKGYGIVFMLVSLILLVGCVAYFMKTPMTQAEDLLSPPSILAKPLLSLLQINHNICNTALALAGLCLKLGFCRSPSEIAT